MKIGLWELVVILVIALLIFGPKSLPKLGEALGKTVGNFRKGLESDDEDDTGEAQPHRKSSADTDGST